MQLSAPGLKAAVFGAFNAAPRGALGLAVSGGGDSMAMLALGAEWAQERGRHVAVITVDHGIRADSAREARLVALSARQLGLSHDTRRWGGWDGQGNLQKMARDARYRLIAAWAKEKKIASVALAHTMEDQAETVLSRLARGSGVDGLSGMAASRRAGGITWLRPLLGQRRDDLRALLEDTGLSWIEDPSNEDPRFERARLRAARPLLDSLGLSVERLAGTAQTMARVRETLDWATDALSREVASAHAAGAVSIARETFDAVPEELRLRLLTRALSWVTGAPYRPRLSALTGALHALEESRVQSLSGALLVRKKDVLWVVREPARCGAPVPAGQTWDGLWRTEGPEGVQVSALGEAGLEECPDWRESSLPRAALLSTPAFRKDGALIAAPFAMPRKGCHVWRDPGPAAFL